VLAGLLVGGVVAFVLSLAGLAAGSAPARADDPKKPAMVLLLDASGSMNEPDGHGSTKMAAAKAALKTIIAQLPPTVQVGLRVYGHRVPSQPDHAKACQDTEIISPVAPLDRAALTAAVDRFSAKGETPIGLSLQQAAKDLPAGTSGSIVLVSDGEDSCAPPEPCAVAKDLKASGLQLTVNTVGLKVDAAARTQLTCISQATGGTYTDVQDTSKLADSLGQIASRSARTASLAAGQPVEGAPALEQAPKLTAGTYSDTVLAGETIYYAVDLAAGQTAKVRITVDGRTQPTNSTGCCLSSSWMDVDGRHYGFANAIVDPDKVVRTTPESGEMDQARTLYLQLQDDGGTKTKTPLPLTLEVIVGGAGASASPSPSTSGSASGSAGASASPGASTPAPTARAGGPTLGTTPVASTGYSGTLLAGAGLTGLVVGLAAGGLGAAALMRRGARPERAEPALPGGPMPGGAMPGGATPPGSEGPGGAGSAGAGRPPVGPYGAPLPPGIPPLGPPSGAPTLGAPPSGAATYPPVYPPPPAQPGPPPYGRP